MISRSRTLAFVAGLLLAGIGAPSSDGPVQLAQWGQMQKGNPTPRPRATPVAGDRQQRRQGAERPASPFGQIRK